jgi:hypothetical protein
MSGEIHPGGVFVETYDPTNPPAAQCPACEQEAKVGHVIDFTPEGEVQAMHNDKFDLSFLGKQSIERATEIKFDEPSQKWGILFPGPHEDGSEGYRSNELALGFSTYEGARQVEVAWLNSCRREGVHPLELSGLEHLRQIREASGL